MKLSNADPLLNQVEQIKLNQDPLYILCIFVTWSIYFSCFSLVALSRFLSSGTVISTILHVISFLSQITISGLFVFN